MNLSEIQMSEKQNRVWSKEDTVRLIDTFRESRLLWDSSTPEYKDRTLRYEKVVEIAADFNTTPARNRKKITQLEDSV
ncbi:hypothetical protein CHUAL_009921 [Chamberlinius hualienensis]